MALPGTSRLRVMLADLNGRNPFSALAAESDAMLYMAKPYVVNVRDRQRDVVDPTVNGLLAMVEAAARSSRVRRRY